ncbi:MAG: hypothetical protein LBV36_02965 [Chromatiales bacterium]|jgi:hypothetical protein|nr:hypothetical protein [Chromatiales bacterium]
MKRMIAAAALLGTLASGAAQAQQEGFGVGMIIGEPTGVSLKGWLNNTRAVDMGLAWSFSENNSMQLHGDYLLHDFNLLRPTNLDGRVAVFYGVGGRIKFEHGGDDKNARNHDDTLVGVRVPVGVSYYPANMSVELFGEFVPVLDIIPDTKFDLNLAIGGRYYF